MVEAPPEKCEIKKCEMTTAFIDDDDIVEPTPGFFMQFFTDGGIRKRTRNDAIAGNRRLRRSCGGSIGKAGTETTGGPLGYCPSARGYAILSQFVRSIRRSCCRARRFLSLRRRCWWTREPFSRTGSRAREKSVFSPVLPLPRDAGFFAIEGARAASA